MKFTIKKKRDGQGWKEVGSIYASNWQDAKRQFTEKIRIDLANDDQVMYFDDSNENKPEDYIGSGYYDIGGGYWDLPLLDNALLSRYIEDVYTWTINKV